MSRENTRPPDGPPVRSPSSHTLLDAVGQVLPGHLDASAGKGRPGLLLLHERWGVTAQTRTLAERLAREGFVVFAPDLEEGGVARDAEEAAERMRTLDRERAVMLLLRATAALKSEQLGARVGILGLGTGGALALLAAARIPGLAACVPFDGMPERGRADYSTLRAEVQGHYASRDTHGAPDRVDQLEADLRRLGARFELFRYDAQPGFVNEARAETYHPEHAALAFRRAVAFLHAQLG